MIRNDAATEMSTSRTHRRRCVWVVLCFPGSWTDDSWVRSDILYFPLYSTNIPGFRGDKVPLGARPASAEAAVAGQWEQTPQRLAQRGLLLRAEAVAGRPSRW